MFLLETNMDVCLNHLWVEIGTYYYLVVVISDYYFLLVAIGIHYFLLVAIGIFPSRDWYLLPLACSNLYLLFFTNRDWHL